jgi:hypothetical protein
MRHAPGCRAWGVPPDQTREPERRRLTARPNGSGEGDGSELLWRGSPGGVETEGSDRATDGIRAG